MTRLNFSGSLLASVELPDGNYRSFEYDSNGLLTREVNQRGKATAYEYNAYNRLTKVTDPNNFVTVVSDSVSASLVNSFTNGQVGNLIRAGIGPTQVADRVVDARSNSISIATNFQGYVQKILDANGRETNIERNLEGRPLKITFADGAATTYSYDDVTGDLIASEDVDTGVTQSMAYDSAGRLTSRVDGRGVATTLQYSPEGFKLSETKGLETLSFTYYSNGLLKTAANHPAAGQSLVTQYDYDSRGNITKVTYPDGKTRNYSYDVAGNLLTDSVGTLGTTTAVSRYEYDASNRLTKATSPNNEVTRYSYLATGQLSQITDAAGKIWSFEYDSKGQLIRKTDSFGSVWQYGYDGNGNLVSELDPKAQSKGYVYDGLNQMVQANFPDDQINYGYNDRGEVLSIQNANSRIQYLRNSLGWIVQESNSGLGAAASYPSMAITNSYDLSGNLTQQSTSVGTINYGFNGSNRINSIGNSWGQSFTFSYDSSGRLVDVARPGSHSQYSYLDSGAVSSIQHKVGSSVLSFANYVYDLRNIPTQRSSSNGVTNFGYDLNGQLVAASSPSPETFSYDALGNRVSDQTGAFTYDTSSQRLMEDFSYHYQYDANGNLLAKNPKDSSKEAYTYAYSSKNQLIEAKVIEGGSLGTLKRTVTFSYDGLGRRMGKKVLEAFTSQAIERRYLYNGDNMIAEYDGSNALLVRYQHSPIGPDDVLSAEITSSGSSAGISYQSGHVYFLKDMLGSVTEIANGQGQVIQSQEYSSFGKILKYRDAAGTEISTPLVRTAFSFTGREFDEETGLFYYRARYLDPSSGRFIQSDPDPGKVRAPASVVNRYIYTMNSPTYLIDPTGRFWQFVILFAIGFAINYTSALNSGMSAGDAFLSGVIGGAFSAAAPGVGAYFGSLLSPALGYAAGTMVGNVLAAATLSAANSGVNAAIYGGNVGQAFALGFAAGAIGGTVAYGVGPVFGLSSLGNEVTFGQLGTGVSSYGLNTGDVVYGNPSIRSQVPSGN